MREGLRGRAAWPNVPQRLLAEVKNPTRYLVLVLMTHIRIALELEFDDACFKNGRARRREDLI